MKRMAVGSELRGSVVRCPHCQQFVLAPAADTEVAEPPAAAAAQPAPSAAASGGAIPDTALYTVIAEPASSFSES